NLVLLLIILIFFFSIIRRLPISTLFPYTTLFRSFLRLGRVHPVIDVRGDAGRVAGDRRRRDHVRAAEEARSARVAEARPARAHRSEEHTSELQSLAYLVCRLLLEKKK